MKIVLLFVFLSALFYGSFSQSYRFVHVALQKSWFDAQLYCRQYHTDLATIKDQTDNKNVLALGGTQYVWIGLHRTTSQNLWVWSDHSPVTFSLWAFGYPKLSTVPGCVRASIKGWFDYSCKYAYPFVCYRVYGESGSSSISSIIPSVNGLTGVEQQDEMKRQILRLEVKSDQNVSDPGVMTEVLEKIEQILKIKGLEENAILSWKIQSDGNVFQKYQERNVTKQPCH